MVGVVRSGGGFDAALPLPAGVQPLPGPAFVFGVRYTDSPVGPYLEFGVARFGRLGLRPGLCQTVGVVSVAPAKVGARLNWGFPAELGELTWAAGADGATVVRWEDRGVALRAVPWGVSLPAVLPMRGVQHRGDGPVLVPRRLAALLRFARVEVLVPEGDPLACVAGRHGGAVLSGARLLVRPARHPSGVLSSFRAPLREVEPGLSYRDVSAPSVLLFPLRVPPGARTGNRTPDPERYSGRPRAYGSVG